MTVTGIRVRARRAWLAVAAALACAVGSGLVIQPSRVAAAPGPVPVPTSSGPVTGGIHNLPFGSTPVPIGSSGYVEKEYFFSGSARPTGAWGIAPNTALPAAAYTSRMIVRRPTDPSRFNGTLVVEWFNVTDQADNDYDWHRYFTEILNDGFAFAAVSAQYAGFPAMQAWDPVRYGSLKHPGDSYATDIFAQAVQGLRTPSGADPLAGLALRRVIATGDSQSANELSTYIDYGLDKDNRNIDGIMVDSGLSPTVAPAVPVLENYVEGDITIAGPKPKNSGPNYRLWNLAGASHVDHWELGQGHSFQTGMVTWDPKEAGQYGERGVPSPNNCATVGDLFPGRYAWDAGLAQLNRWLVTGQPAPAAPLMTVAANATYTGVVATDGYGNALGGLRLPPIDVPVATYVGNLCGVYGTTTPFSAATLSQLYPTHQAYVDLMAARTRAVVAAGFMLPIDAADLMARACASDIGGPAASAVCPADLVPNAPPAAAPPPPAASSPSSGATGPGGGGAAASGTASSVPAGLPNTAAAAPSGGAWWPAAILVAGALLLGRRRRRERPPA